MEPLESRIAPAAVFTFTDVDGDVVKVVSSRGQDADLAAAIAPYLLPTALGSQCQEIDLSANAATFAGTSLMITARPGPLGGDGRVNIGYIDATGTDDGTALDLGAVKVPGDLGRIVAGDADASTRALGKLTVQSLGQLGTSTQAAGGNLGSFTNGDAAGVAVKGSIVGATVLFSGGDAKSFTVGGSLTDSAVIGAASIGMLKIGGDVDTATISVTKVRSVAIGGSVVGGGAAFDGAVLVADAGTVKIGGDVRGGTAATTGVVQITGAVAKLTVGGSVVGTSFNSTGFIAVDHAKSIVIGGSIHGGDGLAGVTTGSGIIFCKRADSIIVRGSVVSGLEIGGALDLSGVIAGDDYLGKVTVFGSLIGNATNPVVVSAVGSPTAGPPGEVAIASLVVKGRVEHANVLAGFDLSGAAANADGSIGSITVGGDWIASSCSAGVFPGVDAMFGDGSDALGFLLNDPALTARIGRIVIKGQVLGTEAIDAERFGFVAQQIGSFTAGGVKLALTAGAGNDTFALGGARAFGATLGTAVGDGFDVHVLEV